MRDLNVKYGYHGEENKNRPGGLPMGIDTFTPHQLRHTFCTLMYFASVDVMTTRDQMGHKAISVTLGIYTALDQKFKKKKSTASMPISGREPADLYFLTPRFAPPVEPPLKENQRNLRAIKAHDSTLSVPSPQIKIPENWLHKPTFGDFLLELLIRFERTTCSLRVSCSTG